MPNCCRLPEELQRRASRLERIRKAKAELEAEAAAAKARHREEQAEAAEQEAAEAEASGEEQRSKRAARRARASRKRADDAQRLAIETALAAGLESPVLRSRGDPLAMPSRQLPTDAAGEPKPQAQRNHRCAEGFAYTDPSSHILKGSGGWMQGYNAQAAVDGEHQVIVAIGVSNQPSDASLPMLERIQFNTGQRPRPSRGPAPRDLDARGRMDRKLRSKAGQAVYALRKTIVEPVFDQIKGARRLDRFRLRGLEMVNGEWALMATTHNLLKLFRASVATV